MLAERHVALSPDSDESTFFELLVASELLKSFDLGIDEIQEGLIGGGMDGGIDGFYVLVNGDPLASAQPNHQDREISVDVVIFQSKTTPSFSGTALDKLISTLSTLFDLSRDERELKRLYSERLMERASVFRAFYLKSFARISHMTFKVFYVTRGDAPHAAFAPQVSTIEQVSSRMFPEADTSFEFVGAAELLKMLRSPRSEWLELKLSEDALSAGAGGFVALVRLSDFARFLTDEDGHRRRRLFLDNVRDFEGNNTVNEAIAQTLELPGPVDFWMLNNGVTIVAKGVRQAYRALGLQEPKIVNGLQTSTVLFEHFRERHVEDDRTILVRIVVPPDEAARDRIIVATNNQTDIKPGVLRATDSIHKDIELFFAGSELVYERQRNAYRNDGVQLERIITIPQLARSIASTLLQDPYLAAKVNSQTRLVASPDHYHRLFSSDYPLAAYLTSARITKRIEAFLGRPALDHEFDAYQGPRSRTQLWYTQWHVAMGVALDAVPAKQVTPDALAELDVASISDAQIEKTIRAVNQFFSEARRDHKRTVYQLTKSQALTELLLKEMGAPTRSWAAPPKQSASDRGRIRTPTRRNRDGVSATDR
ncbi:AIPR family protein [Microbacterium binotii]|uniref:AIPR family protein n=1 Tax=Microbacterium binotii TaxID=462710 RepID=UPI001F2FDC40|nr:AIPR family protein [Microbacterium binotii]UIN30638.1 AIPR family protein [Microbacterium binotii]